MISHTQIGKFASPSDVCSLKLANPKDTTNHLLARCALLSALEMHYFSNMSYT